MDERLEFTASKIKIIGLLILTVMFVGLGIWLTTYEKGSFERLIGFISIGFFGLGFFVLPPRLKLSGPALILSREGVEDFRLKVGLIPWTDIEVIRLSQVQTTKFMELHLINPEMYSARLPWNLKLFEQLNRMFHYSPFSITFTELSPGFDQAVNYVQHFHSEKFR